MKLILNILTISSKCPTSLAIWIYANSHLPCSVRYCNISHFTKQLCLLIKDWRYYWKRFFTPLQPEKSSQLGYSFTHLFRENNSEKWKASICLGQLGLGQASLTAVLLLPLLPLLLTLPWDILARFESKPGSVLQNASTCKLFNTVRVLSRWRERHEYLAGILLTLYTTKTSSNFHPIGLQFWHQ